MQFSLMRYKFHQNYSDYQLLLESPSISSMYRAFVRGPIQDTPTSATVSVHAGRIRIVSTMGYSFMEANQGDRSTAALFLFRHDKQVGYAVDVQFIFFASEAWGCGHTFGGRVKEDMSLHHKLYLCRAVVFQTLYSFADRIACLTH